MLEILLANQDLELDLRWKWTLFSEDGEGTQQNMSHGFATMFTVSEYKPSHIYTEATCCWFSASNLLGTSTLHPPPKLPPLVPLVLLMAVGFLLQFANDNSGKLAGTQIPEPTVDLPTPCSWWQSAHFSTTSVEPFPHLGTINSLKSICIEGPHIQVWKSKLKDGDHCIYL